MIIRHKFLTHEIDGVEQAYPSEVPLDGDKVYFTDPAYTADNVQSAITETSTKGGQARYTVISGYKGNSNSGRWLEVFAGSASNTTPYVIAEVSSLISLAISNSASSTNATFTVYKNGVSVGTVYVGENTGSSTTGYKTLSSPVSLSPGDTISTQQTSGPSTTDPMCLVNIKVNF